ncbi:MAG: oligosaccharide flippase family protein [bacterium]
MFSNIKHTIKHTAIYSIGRVSTKIIGFILLPLYTYHLTTYEYGILALLEVTRQFMLTVFSFNLHMAMIRWCASEKDEFKRKSTVFTTFFFSAVIGIILLFIFMPFSRNFSQLFFKNSEYASYFYILFATIPLGIINKNIQNLIRIKERSLYYVIITSIKLFVTLSLNIYFVAFLHLGIIGILLSELIGYLLLVIITIPFIIKNVIFSINLSVFKGMFHYSFPLIFSSIAGMLLSMGDRYLIKYYLNYSDVGIYSVGYKIANVIQVFLLNSFQMGFLPIAYKKFDKPDAKRFYSKILTYFVFLLTLSSLALSLFSREIIVIFAQRITYHGAYRIIPLISLSIIFLGIKYNLSLGFHYTKKTKYNAYIISFGAVVNIITNIFFIPLWGIYGAALATIISVILIDIIFYFVSQRYYYVPYEIGKIFKLIITGIGIFLVSLFFNNFSFYVRIVIKLLLTISFPFILYVWNFYEPIELKRLQGAWKKWRNPKKWKDNFHKIKIN